VVKMNQADVDIVSWVAFEDAVRRWLPLMPARLLEEVASELRPGSGGPWEGMVAPLDGRRALLLDEVARLAAERYGQPWPLLNDLLPEVPDDVGDLA
jgi:hypothetical protein